MNVNSSITHRSTCLMNVPETREYSAHDSHSRNTKYLDFGDDNNSGTKCSFCRRIWKVQDPHSDEIFSPPNFHIDKVAMHQHP